MNTNADGDVLGAALFLDAQKLERLGLDTADYVTCEVENGELRLEGVTE